MNIAFPVDENINSYIVKIRYVKGSSKNKAYCIGENGKNYVSDLPKDSGAYKLYQRIPEQYKNRYSFEFDPIRKGKSLNADMTPGESPLRPENITDFAWRGTSDSLAWTMAIAAAFSHHRENDSLQGIPVIAFSADVDFDPQNPELFYPIIKPLCQDGSKKAIDSLERKWIASCDSNASVLVLHEEDANLLKERLSDQNIFIPLQRDTFEQLQKQTKAQVVSCKSNDIKLLCDSLKITKGFFIEEEKVVVTKKRFQNLRTTRFVFIFLLYTALISGLALSVQKLFETLPELPKKTDKQVFFLFEVTKISNYRDELWREEFAKDVQIINSYLGNDPTKAEQIAKDLVRYKELDFSKKVSPFPTPGISLKIPKLKPRLIQILLGNESNNGWAFIKYCESGQSPIPLIFRKRETASKDVPLPSELQAELDILDSLAKGNVVGHTKKDFRFYFFVVITKTIEGCSVKVRFFKSLDEMPKYTNNENTEGEIFVPKMIENLEFDIHTNCIKFRKLKQWKTHKQ